MKPTMLKGRLVRRRWLRQSQNAKWQHEAGQCARYLEWDASPIVSRVGASLYGPLGCKYFSTETKLQACLKLLHEAIESTTNPRYKRKLEVVKLCISQKRGVMLPDDMVDF